MAMNELKKNEHYIFLGAHVKPLLLSTESDGNLSVFEFQEVKGLEPPFHIHENEDELWRVVEGEITFHFEDQEIHSTVGDSVFVPRGKPHTFRLKTAQAKAILALTSTDFENIVRELATPASSEHEMPSQPISKEQAEQLFAAGQKYGLKILP